MNARDLTVKEVYSNEKMAAELDSLAPQLRKFHPEKLFGKKNCGEMFDKISRDGIITEEVAQEMEERINSILQAS